MTLYLHFDSLARENAFLCNTKFTVSATTNSSLSSLGSFTPPTPPNQFFAYATNGLKYIDDVLLELNLLVLIKDETNPVYNGVYEVIQKGDANNPTILERVKGFDAGTTIQANEDIAVRVKNPNYFKEYIYTLDTSSPIDIGIDPVVFQEGCVWVPNDYRPLLDNLNQDLWEAYPDGVLPDDIQIPTKYRVYYKNLNNCWSRPTIDYRKHCKDMPDNLNYSVEFCTAILPSTTAVQIPEYDANNNITGINYRSILNEPYIYVHLRSYEHHKDSLFLTNNPPAYEATFVVWHDKYVIGSTTDIDPGLPIDPTNQAPQEFPELNGRPRWIVFKSCMNTTMRLRICDDWQVRYYDRFGRDLILLEDNSNTNLTNIKPPVDRYKQTSFVVGVRPNYMYDQ